MVRRIIRLMSASMIPRLCTTVLEAVSVAFGTATKNAVVKPGTFYYQQGPGVGGGSALLHSWTPYPFNTDSALNAAGVARASTTFGIVAAGTYSVDCRLTFRGVNDCQIRLRNTTSTTTVAQSTTSNHFSSTGAVSGSHQSQVRGQWSRQLPNPV